MLNFAFLLIAIIVAGCTEFPFANSSNRHEVKVICIDQPEELTEISDQSLIKYFDDKIGYGNQYGTDGNSPTLEFIMENNKYPTQISKFKLTNNVNRINNIAMKDEIMRTERFKRTINNEPISIENKSFGLGFSLNIDSNTSKSKSEQQN